jgi:hypothetical protein
MPTYYIMDLNKGIAETMAAEMPSNAQIAACQWMTEEDLQVYSAEYNRTGFQGGLNSYRILTNPRYSSELLSFSGRTIDVPQNQPFEKSPRSGHPRFILWRRGAALLVFKTGNGSRLVVDFHLRRHSK